MWLNSKTFSFEAAHRLPAHDGKCARLHGHSFKLTIHVGGRDLVDSGSSDGMLIDFADISKVVKPLIEQKLDHFYLNDSTGLENPTSEELAKWIYFQIADKLPNICAIEVCETCTSKSIFLPRGANLLFTRTSVKPRPSRAGR